MDRKAQLRSLNYSYIKSFLEQDKPVFVECFLDSFLPMTVLGVKICHNKDSLTPNKVAILVQGSRPYWMTIQRNMSLYTYVQPVKRKPRQPKKPVQNTGYYSRTIDEMIAEITLPQDYAWHYTSSNTSSTQGITWRNTP